MKYSKICAWRFGLSLGIWWAVAVFVVGLLAIGGHYGFDFVVVLSHVYVGYANTIGGSIIGALWAFVDGFVFGFLMMWLYNCMLPKA